jgi:hypothetical protein
MTETVADWRDFLPEYFVLPHPSWRTIGWLRGNSWFESEVLPDLRTRIGRVLTRSRTTAADSIFHKPGELSVAPALAISRTTAELV